MTAQLYLELNEFEGTKTAILGYDTRNAGDNEKSAVLSIAKLLDLMFSETFEIDSSDGIYVFSMDASLEDARKILANELNK